MESWHAHLVLQVAQKLIHFKALIPFDGDAFPLVWALTLLYGHNVMDL